MELRPEAICEVVSRYNPTDVTSSYWPDGWVVDIVSGRSDLHIYIAGADNDPVAILERYKPDVELSMLGTPHDVAYIDNGGVFELMFEEIKNRHINPRPTNEGVFRMSNGTAIMCTPSWYIALFNYPSLPLIARGTTSRVTLCVLNLLAPGGPVEFTIIGDTRRQWLVARRDGWIVVCDLSDMDVPRLGTRAEDLGYEYEGSISIPHQSQIWDLSSTDDYAILLTEREGCVVDLSSEPNVEVCPLDFDTTLYPLRRPFAIEVRWLRAITGMSTGAWATHIDLYWRESPLYKGGLWAACYRGATAMVTGLDGAVIQKSMGGDKKDV